MTRPSSPAAKPDRRTDRGTYPGRPKLQTTVSAETLEALEAFAPPRKLGHLIDVLTARWVREVARSLASVPQIELEELASVTTVPGPSDAEANMEIMIARRVLDLRATVTREIAMGEMSAAQLTRRAQDIDTRTNGCPSPFDGSRAEVYQAEAARLDAERNARERGQCERCGETDPVRRNGRCQNVPGSVHDWNGDARKGRQVDT